MLFSKKQPQLTNPPYDGDYVKKYSLRVQNLCHSCPYLGGLAMSLKLEQQNAKIPTQTEITPKGRFTFDKKIAHVQNNSRFALDCLDR